MGSIPGSGRSYEEGNGNPLQYSCLENPMDRGAWWATVHGVTKSRTRLKQFSTWLSLTNSTISDALIQEPRLPYCLIYLQCLLHACMLSPFSRVRLFATPWTVVCQAPLSMGFSRQGYWGRLPHPPTGDLLDPGTEPMSPALQVDSLPTEPRGKPLIQI